MEHRLLVVADTWCQVDGLCKHVLELSEGAPSDVLVIAPALVGRVRLWASDLDGAIGTANARLENVVARLAHHGVSARSATADPDPLQAIEDALVQFPADRILLVTDDSRHENWSEHELASNAEARFGLPVTHVQVPHETTI